MYMIWSTSDWFMNWTPDYWAALGQWLGAIATFLAVYISLRASKPKLKIVFNRSQDAIFAKILGRNPFSVTLVNTGLIPVNVVFVSLYFYKQEWYRRLPFMKKQKSLGADMLGSYPSKIDPGESFELLIKQGVLKEKLNHYKCEGKVRIGVLVLDSLGKPYTNSAVYFLKEEKEPEQA